jgi:hypothetical protein
MVIHSTDAVNRASGFPIHGQHKYIENGHSKILLLLILCEGEGRENCYTLYGVPVWAQAVNWPTLVNAI